VNWYAVPTLKSVSCRRGSPFPTQLPLEGGGHEVQKGCRSVVFLGVLSSLLLMDLLPFSSFMVLDIGLCSCPCLRKLFCRLRVPATILQPLQAGDEVAWRAHLKKNSPVERTLPR
jgi:hypothetical protein